MWAANLCEFLSFVHTLWDDLRRVLSRGSDTCDLLVEAVGAPPTGPDSLGSLELRGGDIPDVIGSTTITPGPTRDGGAGLGDHGDTGNTLSRGRGSISGRRDGQGTDPGAEKSCGLAAGALIQGGTTLLEGVGVAEQVHSTSCIGSGFIHVCRA